VPPDANSNATRLSVYASHMGEMVHVSGRTARRIKTRTYVMMQNTRQAPKGPEFGIHDAAGLGQVLTGVTVESWACPPHQQSPFIKSVTAPMSVSCIRTRAWPICTGPGLQGGPTFRGKTSTDYVLRILQSTGQLGTEAEDCAMLDSLLLPGRLSLTQSRIACGTPMWSKGRWETRTVWYFAVGVGHVRRYRVQRHKQNRYSGVPIRFIISESYPKSSTNNA
jgi:hypothetical protein